MPHFEKMLYDNAQLVNVYLDAFAVSKDLTYSYVARDVLDYLIRDMTHPEGGIYSAEDADSAETTSSTKKKEGLFYIWTLQEVSLTVIFMFISYSEFSSLYFCLFCSSDYTSAVAHSTSVSQKIGTVYFRFPVLFSDVYRSVDNCAEFEP